MFGPPKDQKDDETMLDAFLGAQGVHIVCGGTSAQMVSKRLGKPVKPLNQIGTTDIPPMSSLEGVDLVTEGVLTMGRVAEYVTDSQKDNLRYAEWSAGRDGACRIARMLLEEGTDIHFFAGRAMNPAYQNPDLKIDYNVKMHLVKQIAAGLRRMGKKTEVSVY